MNTKQWASEQRRKSNLESFRMMTEYWPAPAPASVVSPLRGRELLDEAEWLLDNGALPWEVAQVLGRRELTLSRLAYRWGRSGLGTRLGAGREVAAGAAREGKVA